MRRGRIGTRHFSTRRTLKPCMWTGIAVAPPQSGSSLTSGKMSLSGWISGILWGGFPAGSHLRAISCTADTWISSARASSCGMPVTWRLWKKPNFKSCRPGISFLRCQTSCSTSQRASWHYTAEEQPVAQRRDIFPKMSGVLQHISKSELALHYRRTTRGVEKPLRATIMFWWSPIPFLLQFEWLGSSWHHLKKNVGSCHHQAWREALVVFFSPLWGPAWNWSRRLPPVLSSSAEIPGAKLLLLLNDHLLLLESFLRPRGYRWRWCRRWSLLVGRLKRVGRREERFLLTNAWGCELHLHGAEGWGLTLWTWVMKGCARCWMSHSQRGNHLACSVEGSSCGSQFLRPLSQ